MTKEMTLDFNEKQEDISQQISLNDECNKVISYQNNG